MSRFCTPEDVKEYATKAAAGDYKHHIETGDALNPYLTEGARTDWQRGFDNKGPRQFIASVDFDTIYQRGRAAALILQKEEKL